MGIPIFIDISEGSKTAGSPRVWNLLLLQGAFDEIMDTSADNIKSGEPVEKKETILKMFTLIKEMGALNINPQEINQLTDIVGNIAERIKK